MADRTAIARLARGGVRIKSLSFARAINEAGAGDVGPAVGKELFDLVEQLLHLAPLRPLADGALAGDPGIAVLLGKGDDLPFGDVDEGADDGDAVVGHGEFGEGGGKLPLVEEVQ